MEPEACRKILKVHAPRGIWGSFPKDISMNEKKKKYKVKLRNHKCLLAIKENLPISEAHTCVFA